MAKIYNINFALEIAKSKIFSAFHDKNMLPIYDIIELSSGDYLPSSKLNTGNYKVYGGGGSTEKTHNKFNILEKTIGIGRVGARCGCVFEIEPKSWVTDNALYVSKLKKEMDFGFLIHYLNFINLNKYAKQSAQPVISQSGISKVLIPDLEYSIQVEISNVLNKIISGEDLQIDRFGIKKSIDICNINLELSSELQHQSELIKKLRQSILQDAVQGKLVEQNAKDEPAEKLLAKIKAEKQKLITEGKLKKEKELPPISPDESPFELPKGWTWCRLGEIIDVFLGGYAFKSEDLKDSGLNQVLRLGNVKNDKILFNSNPVYVSDEIAIQALSNEALNGDILITMTGTRLKRDYCFTKLISNEDLKEKRLFVNQRVGCMRFSKQLNLNYINISLKADKILDAIFEGETGTANQGNIGVSNIKTIPFPIPPLSEQDRIVKKVEELMQVCDNLEVEVSTQQEQVKNLMQSVLREAFEG